jgi:palmitoyltransferase
MPLSDGPFTRHEDDSADRIAAFKRRQAADFDARYDVDGEYVVRRTPFHERLHKIASTSDGRYDHSSFDEDEDDGRGEVRSADDSSPVKVGEEAWRNQEGERLADFGVDEEADFYDEKDAEMASDDEIPLAELVRKRRQLT